jgi:hypothetical protein
MTHLFYHGSVIYGKYVTPVEKQVLPNSPKSYNY